MNTPCVDTLWNGSADLLERTLDHPFLTQLSQGTLPRDCFNRYLLQDEWYLKGYARHMEMLSGMLQDPDDRAWMRGFALESVKAEHEMHLLLEQSLPGNLAGGPSKVTLAYESFAQEALDSGDAAIALTALLPCTWIYCEVGQRILERSSLKDNPYREWILAYGDENYQSDTRRFLEITERHVDGCFNAVRDRLERIYRCGAILEYAFWDSAYYDDDNLDRILLEMGEPMKITCK